MELKDLVGLHKLSGVTNENRQLVCAWDEDETYDGQTLTFILDNVTYTAAEDRNDGYRSHMEELLTNKFVCKNTFEPIDIFCIHRTKSNYNDADILDCYDLKTAKLIMSVGTDNTDDYYPSFVADFIPENINPVS